MNRTLLFFATALLLCAGCSKPKDNGSEPLENDSSTVLSRMSPGETCVFLIKGSDACFSGTEEMGPLITKDATLRFEKEESGAVELIIRYAWASTGWELQMRLPSDVLGKKSKLEDQSVPGSAILWYDGGRRFVKYEGDFMLSLRIEEGDVIVFLSVSGEMTDPFMLYVHEADPLNGEVEKEESMVIIDPAYAGYERFVNNLDHDVSITAIEALSGKSFFWTIPQNGMFEQICYFHGSDGQYTGLENMKSITLECDGQTYVYSFGDDPISFSGRESEMLLKPVIFTGILAIIPYYVNTYTISNFILQP